MTTGPVGDRDVQEGLAFNLGVLAMIDELDRRIIRYCIILHGRYPEINRIYQRLEEMQHRAFPDYVTLPLRP